MISEGIHLGCSKLTSGAFLGGPRNKDDNIMGFILGPLLRETTTWLAGSQVLGAGSGLSPHWEYLWGQCASRV